MVDLNASPLVTCLEQVEDPRIERAKRHELLDILVVSVLATICGADNRVAMADLGQANQEWLQAFLPLPNGIPSHDTLGRVWARLDAVQLEAGFLDWVQSAFTLTQGQRVAIDGKSVRHSRDARQGQSPLHLVSAWAQVNHLVLAQQAVADRSHAITAMPPWRQMLAREGCMVTLDRAPLGWGCQKAIAQQIREQGADYVLTVKENQKHLHDGLADTFAYEQSQGFADCPHDYAETVGKDHGRIEIRRCGVMGAPDYCQDVDPEPVWTDLQSLVMVASERRCGGQVTTPIRYFISSLPPQAPTLLSAVRNHGSIENSLPWVLDVAFGEEDSCLRRDQAPHNMAILRRIALNVLKQEKTAKLGVAHKRLKAAWDLNYRVKLVEVLLQGH